MKIFRRWVGASLALVVWFFALYGVLSTVGPDKRDGNPPGKGCAEHYKLVYEGDHVRLCVLPRG